MRQSSFVFGHKSNYFVLRNSTAGLDKPNAGKEGNTTIPYETGERSRNQELSIHDSLNDRSPTTIRSKLNCLSITKTPKPSSYLNKQSKFGRPTTTLPSRKVKYRVMYSRIKKE